MAEHGRTMPQEPTLSDAHFVPICKRSVLHERQPTLVRTHAGELLIIRIKGEVYALANRCSHMAKPLLGGRLHGWHIVCPFHSAQFDIRTGKPNGFPATRPIRTYQARIENDDVMVALPSKGDHHLEHRAL